MKKLSAAIVAIAFACVFQNASAQTAPAKKTDTVGSAATTTTTTNPVQPASTPDWLKSDADKKKDNSTFLATPAASDTTKTKQKQKRK